MNTLNDDGIDQATLVALAVERERLDAQIKAMGQELDARRRDGADLVRAVAQLRGVVIDLHPERAGEMMSEPLVVIETATEYLAALREWLDASTMGDINGRAA